VLARGVVGDLVASRVEEAHKHGALPSLRNQAMAVLLVQPARRLKHATLKPVLWL
jgi:hypothetical protein